MDGYDPFKPGASSIDPIMFIGHKSSQGPTTEEERLMEYIKSQIGNQAPEAETSNLSEETAKPDASGPLYMAGAKTIASVGQEIAKQQQFKSQQQQDMMRQEAKSKQEALKQQSGGRFRSIAELIQNYRASMR